MEEVGLLDLSPEIINHTLTMLTDSSRNLLSTAQDTSSVSQANRYLYDLSSGLLDELHQKYKQHRRPNFRGKYTCWNFINHY